MSCEACISGTIHKGHPVGKDIKLGGLSAYATGDETSKKIVIFCTDIFGWKFINTRILADEYAAEGGFYVIVPDFFDGRQLPQWTLSARDSTSNVGPTLTQSILKPISLFVLVPFILKNSQATTTTKITALLNALRDTHEGVKFGLVGFCWGGKYAIICNPLFDATVAAHPSMVSYPADLSKIEKPIAFALAETDDQYDGRERGKPTEAILEKQFGEERKGDFEVVVYKGMRHGWTTRGNMSIKENKESRDSAKDQAVNWLTKYLN